MIFKDAVEFVLDQEGGFSSHPADPGGLTKYGISLRSNPELGEAGIRNLTREQAIEIYRVKYWKPMKLSRFTPRLALPMFDASVNHGPKKAVELLQRALNTLGAGLDVDGIVGPNTIAASKKYSPRRVLKAFLVERLKLYKKQETYGIFGLGWETRLIDVAICA